MNNPQHYETAAADRISFPRKLIYGFGAFVNNILAAAIGSMVIVLNLGLGMNPALVGLVSALPRLTDAFTDPLMGYISDHTRSKWGRRRPYIFVGAIAAGLIFMLLWQLPDGKSENFYFWFFLLGSIIFYLAYTTFATPWVALGYELTPDYHERTRLMGVQNFIGQLAYVVQPWFLWFMTLETLHTDMIDGAGWLAIIIGLFVIGVGILPAILLRERFNAPKAGNGDDPATAADVAAQSGWQKALSIIGGFFSGFAKTLRFRPFLKLCAATFLVFNGFMLVASFQSYVIIYYIFGGDTAQGALYAGWAGTVSAFATFCVIYIVTWLSTKIGKRRAFFISTGLSMVGYALKWFCYQPEMPLLLLIPPVLIAFGLGGLFTLMGSMIADVCDLDELETGERREGMYGSIFWWVVKLGMAAALAIGGFLLNATGFDVALEGAQTARTLLLMRVFDVCVPIISSAVALWAIVTYTITEEKAHQVRVELERRRGKIGVAA
ncbi:MAG: MFS transporter [Lysobacterales bacterium]|jgi:GPH family glycoside/pentoside/hexuronide:cation symporter